VVPPTTRHLRDLTILPLRRPRHRYPNYPLHLLRLTTPAAIQVHHAVYLRHLWQCGTLTESLEPHLKPLSVRSGPGRSAERGRGRKGSRPAVRKKFALPRLQGTLSHSPSRWPMPSQNSQLLLALSLAFGLIQAVVSLGRWMSSCAKGLIWSNGMARTCFLWTIAFLIFILVT
jgi:hypothetical protein